MNFPKTHPLSQTAKKGKFPPDLALTCNEAAALLTARITELQCSMYCCGIDM